jgi:hypothetical protein
MNETISPCKHQCQKCIDEFYEYMNALQEDPQLKAERDSNELTEYLDNLTIKNNENT